MEWADRPRGADSLSGTPIFIRTLYCAGIDACSFTVITIGRVENNCPLVLEAEVFDTKDGGLRVRRVKDVMEIDIERIRGGRGEKWAEKIRLVLAKRNDLYWGFVQEASGVIVVSELAGGRVRAIELATVTGVASPPETGRFSELELGCSRISVVPAERALK